MWGHKLPSSTMSGVDCLIFSRKPNRLAMRGVLRLQGVGNSSHCQSMELMTPSISDLRVTIGDQQKECVALFQNIILQS
jgi:hypothetical protein